MGQFANCSGGLRPPSSIISALTERRYNKPYHHLKTGRQRHRSGFRACLKIRNAVTLSGAKGLCRTGLPNQQRRFFAPLRMTTTGNLDFQTLSKPVRSREQAEAYTPTLRCKLRPHELEAKTPLVMLPGRAVETLGNDNRWVPRRR